MVYYKKQHYTVIQISVFPFDFPSVTCKKEIVTLVKMSMQNS